MYSTFSMAQGHHVVDLTLSPCTFIGCNYKSMNYVVNCTFTFQKFYIVYQCSPELFSTSLYESYSTWKVLWNEHSLKITDTCFVFLCFKSEQTWNLIWILLSLSLLDALNILLGIPPACMDFECIGIRPSERLCIQAFWSVQQQL